MFLPFSPAKFSSEKIELLPQEAHLWLAQQPDNPILLQELSQLLSREELVKALSYRFESDKYSYIHARATLRKILSHYLPIEPRNIKFSVSSYGKPFLDPIHAAAPLEFNLSHSKNLVFYIITRQQLVGIDIEKICPIDNHLNIAKNFFSPQEYLALQSLPVAEQIEGFFRIWTKKEAIIKCIGNGLSYPLDTFDVSLDPRVTSEEVHLKASLGAAGLLLHSLVINDDYQAAYALEGAVKASNFWQYIHPACDSASLVI